MQDILGRAISDFYHNARPGKLWVHDEFGPKVEMQVPHYFRDQESMPELEQIALQECRGSILDIGAGAGSHALALQEAGKIVTALDISPLSAEVMELRGVEHVLVEDIYQLKGLCYDTLLLMMNGIGLVSNIDGLTRFLIHARTLLNKGGQLLFDSSNVAYLYDGKPPQMDNYYGEIRCRYEYKRQKTDWFTWLYIDLSMLKTIAAKEGWKTELLFEDEEDQYLARLKPRP